MTMVRSHRSDPPQMSEKPRILGIDLGTTNTCVASIRNKIPKVVPTDRGNLVLPSVVAYTAKNEWLVGAVAKDQIVTNPLNTVYGAKRLIGRQYSSRVVQELKNYFTYQIVEGPNGEAAVNLGGRTYTLPQISSFVLKQVKTIAEQFMGGQIDAAVISVPAYYNDNQRQAVKEAGRLAGFDVKRIVNEPTAAALAYGFNRGLAQKILVYDLGGGTFDVSVLHINGNVFEVLATGGDTFLGGVDFDNRVIDYVLEKFSEENKIDLSQNPIAMQRIKNAAEAAKIDLTLIPNVVIELPYIDERKGKPLDLRLSLHREQLNALTADLVDRTFEICDQVLKEKGIRRTEIEEVILVGGQSRMPLVQMDIFQGDSEFIVDNEYLGTVKVPVGPAGRKIDFRLNEECLLKLVIDEAGSQKQVTLATRDTPESLRKALEEDQRQRPPRSDLGSQGRRGLLSGFKRILGRS